MILADSSILFDWQRVPSIPTRQIITGQNAGICGVTVTELLTGARNPLERQKTMTLLGAFRPVKMPLWTRDAHFSQVQAVVPQLTFFAEATS